MEHRLPSGEFLNLIFQLLNLVLQGRQESRLFLLFFLVILKAPFRLAHVLLGPLQTFQREYCLATQV